MFLFLVSRVKSVSKAVRRFHIDGCAIAKFGARVEIWTALYDTFTDLTFTFPFQALHNIVYYLHFILQGLGAAIPTLCYVFHYFSPKAKKKILGRIFIVVSDVTNSHLNTRLKMFMTKNH